MEYIDLNTWPRREQFQFFSGMAFPFYNVTSTLDVTDLRRYVKSHGLSFYYALIYGTMTVLNGLEDYKYKIRGDQIVRHDRLDPSFVLLREDSHLLQIVNLPFGGSLEDFCARCAAAAETQAVLLPSADEESRDDMVYISCTPWFSFTSLTNEMDAAPDDSIPRITWGKYEEKEGRLTLPYAVQLNHRLLDGWHLAQLLNGLQAWIDSLP